MQKIKIILQTKQFLKYLILIIFFSLLFFTQGEAKQIVMNSISSAYLEVSIFVSLTLMIFYSLELIFKINTATFLDKYHKFQIPISAFMGILPGCGGAIIIMTQYGKGKLGFGSVIAVLTSTMGDAAFLLLAHEPKTALLIFLISSITGIIFGYLVEWIHGYDFLKVKSKIANHKCFCDFSYNKYKLPWLILLIPGTIIGIFLAFHQEAKLIEFYNFFGFTNLNPIIGILGGTMAIILWFFDPKPGTPNINCHTKKINFWDSISSETAFVTIWVITGYLIFDLGIFWTQFDLNSLFRNSAPFLPLMGVVIGLIPGCGPQIIVTTLYLQGLIPFSAQIGNSISNDGDALFPALAIAPKASIIATVYTAIPALIVSYSFYFLFET